MSALSVMTIANVAHDDYGQVTMALETGQMIWVGFSSMANCIVCAESNIVDLPSKLFEPEFVYPDLLTVYDTLKAVSRKPLPDNNVAIEQI